MGLGQCLRLRSFLLKRGDFVLKLKDHHNNDVHWKAFKQNETGLPSYKAERFAKLLQRVRRGACKSLARLDYNDDRMVFMHTYQQYPEVIVYCECETDVVGGRLSFARKCRMQVTARSGGHLHRRVFRQRSGGHRHVGPRSRPRRCGRALGALRAGRDLPQAQFGCWSITSCTCPVAACETVNVAGYMMGGGYGFYLAAVRDELRPCHRGPHGALRMAGS